MKVVLLQDVKSQGKKNQIIDVSEGYARNFLFPRKLHVSHLSWVRNGFILLITRLLLFYSSKQGTGTYCLLCENLKQMLVFQRSLWVEDCQQI